MNYEIKLRSASPDYKPRYPGLVHSNLVVDIYRVSWFGLKREKIVDGVLADEIDKNKEIIHDYFLHNKVQVKFTSDTITKTYNLEG